MAKLLRVLAMTGVSWAALGLPAANGGPPYLFAPIADSAGPISFGSQTAPSINEQGDVAFLARLDDGGAAIFRGRGGALTTIVASTPGDSFRLVDAAPVSLNAAGWVAYLATQDYPGLGYYNEFIRIGNGTQTNTLAVGDSRLTGDYFRLGPPAIDDAGRVAFTSQAPGGVFLIDGEASRALYTPANTPQHDGYYFPVALNEVGQVGVISGPATGVPAYAFVGDGGPPIIHAAANDTAKNFSAMSVNNLGQTAFLATNNLQTVQLIVRGDGVTTATLSTAGPYYSFSGDGPAINDNGQLVFSAEVDGTYLSSVFDGPDPVANRIVGAGDTLFGHSITSVRMGRYGLNNRGEFAFLAYGAPLGGGDQRMFYVRATPVEPGDADANGVIDGLDYAIWLAHWGDCGASFTAGDFNESGCVTGADYTLWADGLAIAAESHAAAVPEPAAGWLALSAALGVAAGRWARRGLPGAWAAVAAKS